MKLAFVAALALLSIPHLAQARPLPTFDIDALNFSAESVIEGEIVAPHTVSYPRAGSETLTLVESADVRVAKTLAGTDLSGQTVNVNYLSLYRVGQPWITYAKLQKQIVNGKTQMSYVAVPQQPQKTMRSLEKGDRAIFFLDQTQGADKGYFAIASGVRFLRKDRIAGFSQWSNPGGYHELRGSTRAAFDAGFAASLARVSELKRRLAAPPVASNAAFFGDWLERRKAAQNQTGWHGSDAITTAVSTALAARGKAAKAAP